MSAALARPVLLDGELTVQTAAEHKTRLLAGLIADGGMDLDLSGVTELDTAGLQLLLLLGREAAQLGTSLRLLNPSEPVLEVLRLARLDAQLGRISSHRPEVR